MLESAINKAIYGRVVFLLYTVEVENQSGEAVLSHTSILRWNVSSFWLTKYNILSVWVLKALLPLGSMLLCSYFNDSACTDTILFRSDITKNWPMIFLSLYCVHLFGHNTGKKLSINISSYSVSISKSQVVHVARGQYFSLLNAHFRVPLLAFPLTVCPFQSLRLWMWQGYNVFHYQMLTSESHDVVHVARVQYISIFTCLY